VRFKIRKRERAQVKIAVKIPPVKENYMIEGFLEVQLENLTPLCLPIHAKCEIPQIQCVKDLYKPD
jgi:predicted aldo/keto reductase-like oxidoreductase